ncbi:MAG: transcriptional regulator [Nanohaloarchaea archaeon SW_7_43_1]|nr:MAG: transcriptional regulator [Nanohaloarchaea archaeon SW_7_43_1]
MKNEIVVYREQEEVTQEELAEAVGVSRQTINAIERNRYNPSLELAFKLSTYFSCQIEDLFKPDIDVSRD